MTSSTNPKIRIKKPIKLAREAYHDGSNYGPLGYVLRQVFLLTPKDFPCLWGGSFNKTDIRDKDPRFAYTERILAFAAGIVREPSALDSEIRDSIFPNLSAVTSEHYYHKDRVKAFCGWCDNHGIEVYECTDDTTSAPVTAPMFP